MDRKWWKESIVYQIYPSSFQDSDGDGIGDLNGIRSRLDYLKDLGVNVLWLCPIMDSPMDDNGYDISNYRAINPRFGTMEDFDALLVEAHQRGIRIVMDLVVNHTSDEHPWFIESRKSVDNPYRDYYIWKPGKDGHEPNNWGASFGGSAWKYDPQTDMYYLHLFSPKQPDLNWENPAVREEMADILRFWKAKGIKGFRFDVINVISKPKFYENDYEGDGRRFYTDGRNVHKYLKELVAAGGIDGMITVGEMSSTTLENCQQYAALDGSELSMTFNFHHLKVDYPNGEKWTLAKPDYVALKTLFRHWQQGMHNQAWNALFWCNHDQPRIVSRFGDEGKYRVPAAKMLAMVLHGMQGTPYIYQGEEIGMTNPHFRQITDYRDVESYNMFAALNGQGRDAQELLAILASKSRDNSRTPMQWDASKHAGFTQGEPWINLCDNAADINVAAALRDTDSVFYTYQKLIALRKAEPVITWGDYQDLLPESPHLWCYQRKWQGQRLLVIANLSDTFQSWQPTQTDGNWQVLMHNYAEVASQPTDMTLRPFEAVWWLQK
mgnify:CR=1 FL=1